MSEQNINLPITGMSCANCAMNIERSVKKLDGITQANVNFAAEQAAIVFNPDQIKLSDIIAGERLVCDASRDRRP